MAQTFALGLQIALGFAILFGLVIREIWKGAKRLHRDEAACIRMGDLNLAIQAIAQAGVDSAKRPVVPTRGARFRIPEVLH